ncbi:hypothetical protein [Anaeromyxobacter oryzae]|uniref:Uncharacterized protein n=1 Tax=Anaeromyxobacter oryzae TaxID=2918170 RepID=A0ABN6MTT0_9BACT|nr:hypothetical protein [Anaeromyxobacter oryzae]BDG04367.1 hypothetical protein AMOR_33630 [Anaeromyxobacter oryzae]
MNRIESIHVAPTSERHAEPGRFQSALRGAASGLARGVAATVELAAPYVPGGTVLSAAVRGAVAGADGTGAAAGSTPGSSAPDDVLGATRQLQEEARTYNLQYLQLQENMQRESREFTALSNVMKVKHDSAKSAIQNIH